MKTIFRSVNIAVLLAAIMTLGAVVSFAQDPTPAPTACLDAVGQNAARDNITALYQKKDLASLRQRIDAGKGFLEKYGSCGDSVKDMVEYLTPNIPKWEASYKERGDKEVRDKLYARFDAAVKASNWDDVYAAGKEVLVKEPDQVDLMITLGSIGYDEVDKGNANFKYNDDTIRYAKQAIAALQSGKPAKTYGLFGWTWKTKERALAELNLTIGYVMQIAQKNKKDAQPYLYKAVQGSADTAKNPAPYALVGNYYFDELNKLTKEITALADSQKDTDTPEVAKQKVDEIEAKVALANGYAERAMDAFARAYTLGANKAYKDAMYKNLQDAVKVRTGKIDMLTPSWIAETIKKPFPDPTTAVTPISDPKPVTTTTTGTAPGATTTTPPKPPVTTPVNNTDKPPAKPNSATPAKPAGTAPGKPAAKRQASVKKATRKKAA